jgi:hypothetical protein
VRREDLVGLAMIDCWLTLKLIQSRQSASADDEVKAKKRRAIKQARKESGELDQECSHFTYQRRPSLHGPQALSGKSILGGYLQGYFSRSRGFRA